ncbi:MAG: ABC transporter permease [Spirochaetaceae bacterium]|nr:MAG: ABC transporter permease [Spirochaetaceae bacterium]
MTFGRSLWATLGLRTFVSRGGKLSTNLIGSIIGIGLSLIPLVVVMEVADGMIEGITRRYLEVGTYHLQVSLAGDANLESYESLSEQLRGRPGVTRVILERQGMGLLYTDSRRGAVTVRAVPATLYEEDAELRRFFQILEGSFGLQNPQAILIGREIAQKLELRVGDPVKLLTMVSTSLGRSLPRISSFTVSGIFTTGYQELDKLWTYIPLRTGVRVLPESSSSTFLGIKVKDPFDRIEDQLDALDADLPAEAQLTSWYDLERANYKSFQTTRALLIFVMALIVAVATINISSSLIMVVIEKTEEIGILKAIGAHPREITRTFVLTGLCIGVVGVLLGLSLGLTVAVNINSVLAGAELLVNRVVSGFRGLLAPIVQLNGSAPVRIFNAEFYLEEIPIRIRVIELFLVAAASLLLSVLAAFFPARAAARIKPLEVLRKI